MKNSVFSHAVKPLLIFLLILDLSFAATTPFPSVDANQNNIEYIKTSCGVTLYERLCFNSLSIYATKIESNPKSLAHAALNVTLAAALRTSKMMKKLTRTHFLRAKEAAAMSDCMEVLGDSVDELKQSLEEMDHVGNNNFGMTISDIETWVSAALTDEDSCMDGFSGVEMNGELKSVVGRYIVKVAHLSSNALALVNKYAASTN